MTHTVLTLENDFWQAGVLPGTGASLAFGRVKRGGAWVDILRPTAEADYGNVSACASFLMLPWCNRIRDGKLLFEGKSWQLETSPVDNTSRHGVVRDHAFDVASSSPLAATLTFNSTNHENVNWPFAFTAEVTYRLDGPAFVWTLTITNTDTQPFPAGFGHHPYFVRPEVSPILSVPCDKQFTLVKAMAEAAPTPITPRLDFRTPRALPEDALDDLLTGRIGDEPVRISFPDRDVSLTFSADPIFVHWLPYAPVGMPFFAVEPMTNASDGFTLDAKGIPGSGTFVLQPGESRSAVCTLLIS